MIGQWTWLVLAALTFGATFVLIGRDFLRLAQDDREEER